MQTVSKKIRPYLPHNWLELKGLSRLFSALFYATLTVGIYAAGCWINTFLTDPAALAVHSAPLRKIYLLATFQAVLACIGWALLIQICRTLQALLETIPLKNPADH